MRVAPCAARQIGHELGAQGLFHPVSTSSARFPCATCASPFHGEGHPQQRQHARRMFRTHLGQHHGNRLRIFVLQVVRQHVSLTLPSLSTSSARRTADLLHNLRGAIARQRLLQQAFGAFETADRLPALPMLSANRDKPLHRLGTHRPELRHGAEMSFSCLHASCRTAARTGPRRARASGSPHAARR